MKKITHIIIFLFCFGPLITNLSGQSTYSPEREFRGVWVATVKNIDYPMSPTTSSVVLQEEFKNLLDRNQELGMNAVVVQIRSTGDAFYPSDYAPWSKYLTGQQGSAPDKRFDPLNFMIKEAHQRGMAFHAWMNPYRVSMDTAVSELAPDHIYCKRPDWMLLYGNRYMLNPAIPEVQDYLADVIGEVVRKYDVDAIHMDDYFYPYPIAGRPFPDSLYFNFYANSQGDIGDWRRNNVNQLIQKVSQKIESIKPNVEFGISPFGVWRNQDQDPAGSATRAGATTYDDLYADVLLWAREGWIDYLAPQLYFSIGYEPAAFDILLDWWTQNTPAGCALYIGQGAYKVGTNQVADWHEPDQIQRQVNLIRRNSRASGSIFFSEKSLRKNNLGVRDSIARLYNDIALLPVVSAPDAKRPAAPSLTKAKAKKGAVHLYWRPGKTDDTSPSRYYAVYRGPAGAGGYTARTELIAITGIGAEGNCIEYLDEDVLPGAAYQYHIRAISAHHLRSEESNAKQVQVKGQIQIPESEIPDVTDRL